MSESRDEVVEVRRGRPLIHIEREHLWFLMEEGFRINDIAAIFSCSRRTIERRLGELQLRFCDYSRISDATLDEVVGNIILIVVKICYWAIKEPRFIGFNVRE